MDEPANAQTTKILRFPDMIWVQLLSFTTTEHGLLPPDFWPVFGNFPLHLACLSRPNGPGPGRNSDFCGPEKAFCTTFGAGK
jgi:hypothetical protein